MQMSSLRNQGTQRNNIHIADTGNIMLEVCLLSVILHAASNSLGNLLKQNVAVVAIGILFVWSMKIVFNSIRKRRMFIGGYRTGHQVFVNRVVPRITILLDNADLQSSLR